MGADVVGSLIDFGFEVVHFEEAVGGGGVAFGEACDSDFKLTGVVFDEGDEVVGVFEVVLRAIVVRLVAWGIAAKSQDGLDLVGLVLVEDGGDFVGGVADAGEVWDGGDGGFLDDAADEGLGAFAGRSACAVGDADKGWVEGVEFVDRGEEVVRGIVVFWGEEFEGKGGFFGAEGSEDAHWGRKVW